MEPNDERPARNDKDQLGISLNLGTDSYKNANYGIAKMSNFNMKRGPA